MRTVFHVLATIFSLLYPFLVYYLLQHNLTIVVAIILLLVLLVRLIAGGLKKLFEGLVLLTIGLLMMALYLWDNRNEVFLLLYPVMINVVFLTVFGSSLAKNNIPIVQKIASLHVKKELQNLAFKDYCRNVTIAWCLFFVVNGSIALVTVIYGNREIWTLYNGVIAYILIGIMFVAEYLVRRFVKKVG